MLRITEEKPTGDLTRLRLDGRVVREWVAVLAQVCLAARDGGGRLVLDMAGVHFLDAEAVRLMKRLMSDGVEVLGSTGFVREQLGGGDHGSTGTR